jgi:ABC-type Mn2+/Zn2+ transport system permease subunit
MNSWRAPFQAVFPLAVVFSAAAAVLALVLDAAGDVSAIGLAMIVAVVGFLTSWFVTGRTTHPRPAVSRHHRVAHVPVRHSIG